jgi:hypothetical protein
MIITYPPELLPLPDEGEGADVFVIDPDTGEKRLIASFPASPGEELTSNMLERSRLS